ncbi:MAG: hypothetical protein K1V84_08660 [Muribaculaceae bacterium]
MVKAANFDYIFGADGHLLNAWFRAYPIPTFLPKPIKEILTNIWSIKPQG